MSKHFKHLALWAALLVGAAFGPSCAMADTAGSVTPGTRATQSDLTGCNYVSGGISLANGQQAATQCDAAGNIRMNPTAPTGNQTQVFPSGQLRVIQDPTQVFYDSFDTGLDTTNRWATATGGTGIAATNVVSNTVIDGGTTLNSFSKLTSQFTFQPSDPGWLTIQYRNNVEFPVLTTGYRAFGYFAVTGSPTIAAPVTDGAVFEIRTDGKLYAATYAGGARLQIADLSVATGTGKQPQDSSSHKYFITFRGDQIYWSIDNQDQVIASTSTGAQGPNVNGLTLNAEVISNAGTHETLTINAVVMGDTTHSGQAINDGTFGWRKATVTAGGLLRVDASAANNVGITPTDHTITSASGSSQTLMAANSSRHSMTIVNTGNANCGVNPTGGTAAIGGAGTLTLSSLGAYTPRIPTLSAVTIICTAGQPIYGDDN